MKVFIDTADLTRLANAVRALFSSTLSAKFSVSDMLSRLKRSTSLASAVHSFKIGRLNTTAQALANTSPINSTSTKTLTITLKGTEPNQLDPYEIYIGALMPSVNPTVYYYTGASGKARYNATSTPSLGTAISVNKGSSSGISVLSQVITEGGGKRFEIIKNVAESVNVSFNFTSVPIRTSTVTSFSTTQLEIVPEIFYYIFVIGPSAVTIGSITG